MHLRTFAKKIPHLAASGRTLRCPTWVLFGVLVGCSNAADDPPPGGGSGGGSAGTSSATGGGTHTGGVGAAGAGAGGASVSGGTSAGGQAPTSGGSVAQGGSSSGGSSAGGTTSTTGGASSGGTTLQGGAVGTTGGVNSGGTSSGGASSSGGKASGGTAGQGGAPATGGKSSSGGASTGGSAGGGVVGQPVGFASLNGGTIGGKNGKTVTVSTFADLKQYASAAEPLVILVAGKITNGSAGGQVKISSNKSVVGIGSTAFLEGIGIEVASSNNVIIQNLKVTLVGTSTPGSVNGGDAIVINGTSKNVWIDHCEIYSEDPKVQTNIDKYDGLIDIRDQTGFITVSWSYLHDHHKGCLVGASDTDLHDDRKVTYHHNYFRNIIKRMPMYRGSVGHFFNNYVIGTSTTEASFVVKDTCLRIEKNVYETVKFAIYSGDVPGKAQRIDNIATQSRAYPENCTADIPYDYAAALTNTTSDVKTVVPAGAGVGKI